MEHHIDAVVLQLLQQRVPIQVQDDQVCQRLQGMLWDVISNHTDT